MSTIHIQTAQNVFIEYQPAGVGDRILAHILDSLIKVAYGFLVGFGLFYLLKDSLTNSNETLFIILIVVLVALPIVFYKLILEIIMDGQTIGKRVMHIKVVKLDGSQPGIGDYILRWLLSIIDMAFWGLVAVICIASSQNSQRVGDMAASTTVISLRRRSTLANIQMPKLDTNYQPEFPQVARLSDADVDIIRQTLQTYRRNMQDTYMLSSLRAKLETLLGITSAKHDLEFLETLLRDHAHITSQE